MANDMLPAWATVLLSLIAGLAGVTAAIYTTERRIRFEREERERQRQHQRAEHIRDRQLLAADDMVTVLDQALDSVHALIGVDDDGESQQSNELESNLGETRILLTEASARLARLELLFGEQSEVPDAAQAAISYCRMVVHERPDDAFDVMRALRFLADAHLAVADLNAAALAELRGEPPPLKQRGQMTADLPYGLPERAEATPST